MTGKRFIFRWKDYVDVPLSRCANEEDVWAWAIRNLRPAGMGDAEAEVYMRKHGSVREVGDGRD